LNSEKRLRFTAAGKAYYKVRVYEFNLPAGWSCPCAVQCLVKADRMTGRHKNGEQIEYKCYAAVAERFPSVREYRWANFDMLRRMTKQEMIDALTVALPSKATHIRIHGSGDFFNQDYFDAWLAIAQANPLVRFWAYTKSIRYWVARINSVPENLILQASYGGRDDALIATHALKYVRVVASREEADDAGLPVCVADDLAMSGSASFALIDNYAKAQ
jgi:hypothetical protein